jgi:hypothetical protein
LEELTDSKKWRLLLLAVRLGCRWLAEIGGKGLVLMEEKH